MRQTYKENGSDIEQKCCACIGNEDERTSVDKILEIHRGQLHKESDDEIHHSTDRCIIVQADKRVHFVRCWVFRVPHEQFLHHDETDGLKEQASKLV